MLGKRVQLLLHVLRIAFRLRPVATVVLIVLMILEAISATVLAVVQGQLIQRAPTGLGSQVVVSIAVAALLVVALVVSYRVMWTLRRDVSDAVELVLIEDLLTWTTRPATVDHLQDPVFLDRLSVVVRRTNGLGHAAWSAVMLVCSSASVITSLVVLARISWPLVLLAVLAVPPILLAGRSGDLYMQAIDKNADLLRLEDQLTTTVTDAGSLKELMVSGSAPTVDARASQLWQEMAHHEWVARGWAVILTSAGWLVYGIGTAVALGWVIALVRAGQATVGDVGVVAGLAVYLAQQIMNVLSFRVQVTDSGRVIDHYRWIRERTAELAPAAPALTRIDDAVELDGIGYSYPGASAPSLDELSLRIPAGTVLGVVGVNGAGKSTLARILTGLSTPTTGELRVDGRPVRPGELSGAASGAFQDYARLELRADEAVGTAGLDATAGVDASVALDRSSLDSAARSGGADAVVRRLDDGWDSQLGATFDGAQLSQGQWQRLALSRGLFKPSPVVLVLDEPTAALDPQSEHDLFAAFAGRARRAGADNGAITVLVSHRFSTVTMTDLIIVLDDGRLVEQGTHAELMAADGTYRRLFEAQARGYADAEPDAQAGAQN